MSIQADLAIVPGFRAARPALAWRALSGAGDLDLEFTQADRPRLVTEVLAACADPPLGEDEGELIWRLSLAARIGGLLAIQARTAGTDTLPLTFGCPDPECRERMEVSLPIPDLMAMAREAEQSAETEAALPSGGSLRLRRPTGVDQRLWRQAAHADYDDAERAVLNTLVVGGTLDAADTPAVAEALAEFDPLSCFELDVTCPDCSKRANVPVDLEAVLLGALAREQDRILDTVDRLARRYGWSEAEILAIPPWRRQRYLAREDAGWPA